jgi:hypothetical protein
LRLSRTSRASGAAVYGPWEVKVADLVAPRIIGRAGEPGTVAVPASGASIPVPRSLSVEPWVDLR